jgi:hypothetical protein
MDAALCDFCFARFCSQCLPLARKSDIPNGCCGKGHRLHNTSAQKRQKRDRVFINNRYMSVKRAVGYTAQELARNVAP